MFIRKKTSKNTLKTSVQIVESYRNEKNQPRQRIVRHLGSTADIDELNRLLDFAEHELIQLENKNTPTLFKLEEIAEIAIENRKRKEKEIKIDFKKLKEKNRIVTGIHEAFGKVYNEIGFNNLFGARKTAAKNNLRHITMARIANPESKRRSVRDMSDDFGINLSLDSVYRMMDSIDSGIIDKAQKLAYESTKSLLGGEVNLLFYDCTTLYFESFTEDELKKNGFSKDLKFNQPQVIIGLLVTSEGLPVGYEVFPGNQYEEYTLNTIIPKIKTRYNLKRIIFTADSAMLSKKNLAYLEEENIEYIVAARLKTLNKDWINRITSSKAQCHSFNYGDNRRLIVTYSDKLARKNKHDRDKAIDKLKKKLEKNSSPVSLISNYGYKRFIKIEGKSKITINEEKYNEAAKFDGLHGVITNVKDLSDNEVIEHYRSLWQIEECFRINKHDLRIRPIYHWTPKRIQAHLLICFLAFTCVKHLMYKVRLRYEAMSAEKIINALNHIQLSILYHTETEKHYALPSKFNDAAKKIYTTLNIKVDTTPFSID